MTIRFACLECGRQLQLPDDAAGKRQNCPDCGRSIDVPVIGSIARFGGRIFGDGLAVAPIVLGVFALFFCWVPILGAMMAVPLGLIGTALGVLGCPVGVLRGRKALMRSLGGIALCVLAIVASFVSTGALITHLKNDANQAGPRLQQQDATALAPNRPCPRDKRVMTIDGHRADAQPQVDRRVPPVHARIVTSHESTTQRNAPVEQPRGGTAATPSSTSGGTTRDR